MRGAAEMKKLLLKTSFHLAVGFLTLVFLVPAYVLLETVLPSGPEPGRPHGSGDRLLPGLLLIFACLYAADRIVSRLFRLAGLADRRWSVLARRTSG
jgi:hypothetical protein